MVYDYWSGFIEVECLQSTTTSAASKAVKVMFARYGVPNVLITNNGPQFSSADFLAFARVWDIQHVISSPRYPQFDGKAESAVKTVKQPVYKVSGSKTIRVPGTLRLAKHTNGGFGYFWQRQFTFAEYLLSI